MFLIPNQKTARNKMQNIEIIYSFICSDNYNLLSSLSLNIKLLTQNFHNLKIVVLVLKNEKYI